MLLSDPNNAFIKMNTTHPSPEGGPAERRIRILPDNVINQIAAGEVIERPVAAVKELIENSLDSGATRIEIEFRNGGKSYIRVEDNGCGMSPDEAMLALERHATSKLKETSDLLHIRSLGFRGEALPSIASVSRFTLQTRRADWDCGSEILINGGKLIHQKACGIAPGTRIEVAHLFNSVPARRKFLKTDNTEAAHIIHLVRLHAVARPQVAFHLIEDGRELFRSPVCTTLRDRIREIWGRSIADELSELPAREGKNGLQLHGLIGKPGSGRTSRREMVTLVNGRPVDSRTLSYALIEAYHTFIPKGRYPLAFLFLDIDPAAVDVNIHPAKREVRFRDEAMVRQFVLQSIQQQLKASAQPDWAPSGKQAAIPQSRDTAAEVARSLELRHRPSPSPAVGLRPTTPTVSASPAPAPSTPTAKIAPQAPVAPQAPAESFRLDWKFITRLEEGLALFESAGGLVVMELRAAHQRIRYEKIQRGFSEGKVPVQPLLIPIPLELEPLAAAALSEHTDFLQEHGFQLETFGRHFYRIQALPQWLPADDGEHFVRDLISDIREGRIDPSKPDLAHKALARMAAAQAVLPGERLNENAIKSLARELLQCENPLTSPLGHRTFFELDRKEIQRRLGKV